jgi:hypothetical protein
VRTFPHTVGHPFEGPHQTTSGLSILGSVGIHFPGAVPARETILSGLDLDFKARKRVYLILSKCTQSSQPFASAMKSRRLICASSLRATPRAQRKIPHQVMAVWDGNLLKKRPRRHSLFLSTEVCCGSNCDKAACPRHVRFTPDNRRHTGVPGARHPEA